jgi:hypothetical protein
MLLVYVGNFDSQNSLREGHKLRVFENRALRKIFTLTERK